MRPWCVCCRRRRTQKESLRTLARWRRVLRHLRRLGRLQRVFAYVGHDLQTYPDRLRRRLRATL
eukprot:6208928-Heterocapsa_arctica.AAC.1